MGEFGGVFRIVVAGLIAHYNVVHACLVKMGGVLSARHQSGSAIDNEVVIAHMVVITSHIMLLWPGVQLCYIATSMM